MKMKGKRFTNFIVHLNDLVLRAKTEKEIINECCNLAIKYGNFKFAWLGEINHDTHLLHPISWAGFENGYLQLMEKINLTNLKLNNGPTGKAFRENKIFYSNDIANDPAMEPWRSHALDRGYQSSIAIPIIVENKLKYVASIYADQPNWFDKDEIDLLVRISENIGFALSTIASKKREKSFQNELKKLSTAALQTNASIVITNKSGTIEYVNPAFCKLTGFSKEEAIGQNPRILKSGVTSSDEYKKMYETISSGQIWRGEFCNKKKSGELYWEYAIISPVFNDEGDLTHFLAVKDNISERKQVEQDLHLAIQKLQLRTAELEYSNKELERFAYVASHDLQEPLRMVTSFLQLFEHKFPELLDQDAKKYIHFAVDGANRMKLLLNDLLQYSRAGTKALEFEPINLNLIVEEVLQIFQAKIEVNNIKINKQILPIVNAGSIAMLQLFQNLIGNAIKYRSDIPLVIEIFEVPNDEFWIIGIKDNGIGIKEAYFEKIFDIFQRLHLPEEFSGTGVGLSICKKIVQRYKGKIWVESTPNLGSTFYFSLPKANMQPIIQND
jgi:PAS domain S-box-containing protein